MSTAPRPHTSPSTISPRERIALPAIGVDRHDIGVAHQQERRRVRVAALDARDEVLAAGLRGVALEVETGVAEVLREHVGAAALEARLGRAVVDARVADQVREQVARFVRDGRRRRGSRGFRHAGSAACRLPPTVRLCLRSPCARGGRRFRDSAIVPQCRFGKTSCESCGTVAGPSATPALAQQLHALDVMFLDRARRDRRRRRTDDRARAARPSRPASCATSSSVARYERSESA